MPFLIRPAHHADIDSLHALATSLSATGFLTLPSEAKDLEALIGVSERSFGGKTANVWDAQYLFSLEDLKARRVVGCSLIIARHGTEISPHLYFQLDPEKQTLTFVAEETGRTELGGLILDPAYRGAHRSSGAKLGKALSLIRFVYLKRHPQKFCEELVAELLPRFTPDGKSPFWESLGRRLTGMDYRDADRKSRKDKRFFTSAFPRGPISLSSLSPEAQSAMGQVGPETEPVVRILTAIGFRYLHQIDPFDGGPHYGARQSEIRFDVIDRFFEEQEEGEIRWTF